MIDQKALEVERVYTEENTTVMTTASPQVCSTELIDTFIEDARNIKETLVSEMESVISLMRKVESEEIAAKQAKEEADQSSFDILVKVNERKQAHIGAQKSNDMLVRKVYEQKAILATKMEVLQWRMQHVLDDAARSLGVLDEMNRSLEMRLATALLKKGLATKKKQENEALSQVMLAYVDLRMEKIVEASKRWKQEDLKISKLLEFLNDRDHVVNMLHGDISDECQDVNHLKQGLDKAIPLGGLLSSNRTLSSLAASSSSLKSSEPDRVEDVVLEADVKVPHMAEGITEGQATIECNGESPRDVKTREVNKLCGNQMIAKIIKKTKINNKLHRMCANRIKKVKIKGLQVVLKRSAVVHHKEDSVDDIEVLPRVRKSCASRIKKVKIKGLQVVSKRSASMHDKEDSVDDIEVLPRVRNRANEVKSRARTNAQFQHTKDTVST